MSNVYYVGSEPLSFEGVERILTQNMKLELSLEVKERIQRAGITWIIKSSSRRGLCMGLLPVSVPYVIRISLRTN